MNHLARSATVFFSFCFFELWICVCVFFFPIRAGFSRLETPFFLFLLFFLQVFSARSVYLARSLSPLLLFHLYRFIVSLPLLHKSKTDELPSCWACETFTTLCRHRFAAVRSDRENRIFSTLAYLYKCNKILRRIKARRLFFRRLDERFFCASSPSLTFSSFLINKNKTFRFNFSPIFCLFSFSVLF